jgi:peptidoglycan/xylan/chitin deacetylase (PgdA/CDA1 family)
MTSTANTRRLAILAYHKIGPAPGGWQTWNYIPEETFAGHLRCLREGGWEVIDLAALLGGLSASETLPDRAALVTFDDGYRSNLTAAVPLLRQFGYPAVLFVPTDFIGRRNTFDEGAEPEEWICDWDELRALERAGVAVQSHGASHRPLSDLDAAARAQEMRRSRAILEEGLGRPVEVFCYPYGDEGADREEAAAALRRAGYRAACLYGGGPNSVPVVNPYRLARLALGPDTDLDAALRGIEA